jgi:hypothetical protein
MTRQEILEALENGYYSVNYEENCYCSFDWNIEGGHLIDNACGVDCWEGNILYIGNTPIVEVIRSEDTRTLVNEISLDDINNIDVGILDCMKMGEIVMRGESPNNMHENQRREELIKYLMECGYILEEDEERGFANEYTSILREPEYCEEVTTTREQAEKWADSFLYSGDGATEAYNGFRYIARGEN